MRMMLVLTILMLLVPSSFAETPRSYAEANAIWKRHRDTAAYQSYAGEFAQFNNSLHLDEKDGCYDLGSRSVHLLLVITRRADAEFAVVDQVLSDVDDAKARCFRKTYSGIPTKIPPFQPFVLQLAMG